MTTRDLVLPCLLVLGLVASAASSATDARYIRVENPTGFVMTVRQIEVFSGGKNVVLKRREITSGTVPPLPGDTKPTYESIVVSAPREGGDITNGDTDTSHRASEWRAYTNPETNAPGLNPWFELDLGAPMPIEKVVIYGSAYPNRIYIDKGHRVVSLLDKDRKVAWAAKWQYYDTSKYPKGVFSFDVDPVAPEAKAVIGTVVPPKVSTWISMSWLLDAEASQPPPDAAQRAKVFAARNSPDEIKKLGDRFFPLLDERIPEIAAAKQLHAAGKSAEAFDAWKKYWFAKMARVNLHAAYRAGEYVTYSQHGDDLLKGLLVTITPHSARAQRYEPGQIYWINLPATDGKELNAAIDNCIANAAVNRMAWPLLYSYLRKGDAAYVQRWSEILDDWALNFFADAAKVPNEVEDLFTFNPVMHWHVMMEDLAEVAAERPTLVDLVPATTFARIQLLCLEKYSTAWWRQIRETVFNHNTGGIFHWHPVLPYIDEFHAGQRTAKEWRQGFERFMTLGHLPDGCLTEIGDEGHQEIPIQLGMNINRAELTRPAWYTPGWRNRALQWHDNTFRGIFRHLAPGGYEHRWAVDFRPQRWNATTAPYCEHHPQRPPLINRDKEIFGDPEIRSIIGSFATQPEIPDPLFKGINERRKKVSEQIRTTLGGETPGLPRFTSDWMPYTGAYYFRGGWAESSPFLAMMACGAHGGSQAPQWPYSMFYAYDFRYPLISAKPVMVDGLPPDYLQGRRHTFQPGTKTMALTNADERPAQHRWLSSSNFTFGEAKFSGEYNRFPTFKGPGDYRLEMAPDSPPVAGVETARQILQLRGSRLFIVTDRLRIADGQPRTIAVPYTLPLSTRMKSPSKPFGPEQLQLDEKSMRMRSENPDGPSTTLYQFSDQPLAYRKQGEAKVDTKKYSNRLTGEIGIAEQIVNAEVKSEHLALVSLVASRDKGAAERVKSIEPLNIGAAVGFHATMEDGSEVWYQSAGFKASKLACGPGAAEGEALLVVKEKAGVRGIVLGATSLTLDGKPITLRTPDAEFTAGADGITQTGIYAPIDPVSFKPGRNTFADSERVELSSATPGVEIRYTTDGTPPTHTSTLYTGPITITASTEFAARAYRLGADGKPLPAVDFEINGTLFTEPTYGWFYKRPPQPAVPVNEKDLAQGLSAERVDAPWWSLYSNAHWLPAKSAAPVAREMDALPERGPEAYAMRYKGYLRVLADGVYTFHAPRELVYMDYATSYDLRVYIDGEEWDLTQWWHGHGTWSIPLSKGFHTFQVDFADARTNPWRKSGVWRYYPRPWAIYPGKPGDIKLTGPGIDNPARIPSEWLFRDAKAGSPQ